MSAQNLYLSIKSGQRSLGSLTEEERKSLKSFMAPSVTPDMERSYQEKQAQNAPPPAPVEVDNSGSGAFKRGASSLGIGLLEGLSNLSNKFGINPDIDMNDPSKLMRKDVSMKPEEKQMLSNSAGLKGTKAEEIWGTIGRETPAILASYGGVGVASKIPAIGKALTGSGKWLETGRRGVAAGALYTPIAEENPDATDYLENMALFGAGDVAAMGVGKAIAGSKFGKAVKNKLGKGATRTIDDAIPEDADGFDLSDISSPSVLEQMQNSYQGLKMPKTQAEKALPDDNLLLNQMRNTYEGKANMEPSPLPRPASLSRNVDTSLIPDKYPLPDVGNIEGKAWDALTPEQQMARQQSELVGNLKGERQNYPRVESQNPSIPPDLPVPPKLTPEQELQQLARQQKEIVTAEQGQLGKGARRNIVAQPSPDPVYLKEIEGRYNKLISEEVASMKEEIGGVTKYMPDEQNGPLLRASLNSKWYRDFWDKNGRSPREGEYRDMAIKNLIEGTESDIRGSVPASDEFRQILSELSRGSKLPDEWHGLQKTIGEVAATDNSFFTPKESSPEWARQSYENGVVPDGWYVHGRSGQQMPSDYMAQSTRDWEVAHQYSHNGGSMWMFKPNKNSSVMDMTKPETINKIAVQLEKDYYNGVLPPDLDQAIEMEGENFLKVVESFNPKDILDSAEGFDNPQVAEWLGQKFEPDMVITNDGAIVLNHNNVDKIKVPSQTAAADNGLKSLADDMLAEQKRIEPYGLTKNLDRLTEIENNARKGMKDYMDFRKQYPNAIGIVNKDAEFVKNAVVLGAVKAAKKGITYAQWSAEMLAERPELGKNLPYIWHRSQELMNKGATTLKFNGQELPVNMQEIQGGASAGAGQPDGATVTPPPFADTGYDTAKSINSASDLKAPLNIPEKLKRIYRSTVDKRRIFNDVDEYMKKTTGKGLSTSDKLYIMATNSSSAEGMAQTIMEKHMVNFQGEAVGDSFANVISRATDAVGGADNWRVFEDYNKLNHATDWMKKGRDVYPEEAGLSEPVNRIKQTLEQIDKVQKDKSMNKDQKAYVVTHLQSGIDAVAGQIEQGFIRPRLAKIEQQFPGIGQTGKQYGDWIAQFGEEWGVKSGLIKPEDWAALRQEYPNYVPLQRVMDEVEEGLMGTGAGFANQSNPLKKGKGSDRNTLESVEVMIERIPQYIKMAKKNEVAQNLYRTMEQFPKEMEESWGKIVSVKPGDPVKPNVITARVNGKEVSMEITNPALLEGMSGLSQQGQNVVVESVRAVTSLMKTLITGVNPLFAIGKNVFYDTPSAFAYSKTLGKIPGTPINNPVEFSVDLVDSLFRIVTNEKWHKEKYLQTYRDMGGGSFSSSSADRNLIAESKARIMPGYIDPKKPAQALGRGAKLGYQGLQKLMSVTETLPRLPEFKRVVQKEGNSYDSRAKGLYEGNDITFNFSRHGDGAKFIDAFVPYFNAAVQGLDKFGRSAVENPTALVANSLVAVTAMEAFLYSQNHDNPDYQALSEAVKARYYCFSKGDGTFVKIVKPREIGVLFGTAITDVLDYMRTNDPAEFDSFKMGLKNSFLPPDRTLAAPFNDLYANKNFTGTPIVPGYMEGLSPEYQYDANTSAPAKAIGKALGQSPKQIDYLGKSYGGILTQIGQPATAEGGSVTEAVKRQFVADPVYSNDTFTKFYEEVGKLTTADKNVKAGHPDAGDNPQKRIYLNRVSDVISKMRKAMRAVEEDQSMDAEVKKKQLRAMHQEMVGTAQDALDNINGW